MKETTPPLHIIAIDDESEYGKTAVLFGELLAPIFKSQLIIEHHHKKIDKQRFFQQAEENNVLMVIIGVSTDKKSFFNPKSAVSFIKNERIPVLVVGNKLPQDEAFKSVLLTVDVERKAKEKAMWASYFNRFYGAAIHLMRTQYHDSTTQNKVDDNIYFIEKLYRNLNITYKIHHLEENVLNADAYSLQFAKEVNASLTIIMMTKYYSFIDFIFGAKEKSLLQEANGYPVLCLNERDDLCVLCT